MAGDLLSEVKIVQKIKVKKFNILTIFALLGVIFATTFGVVYANITYQFDVGSNVHATSTYMAIQEHVVINDTDSNPITFSDISNITDVAIEYSYGYDFDIRIKYSLIWLAGSTNTALSTNNVILNFPNRDSFIVDDSYIYYKDTIPAGCDRLKIISSVDFIDVYDITYIGHTLKIKIDEVKITKSSTAYTDANPLFLASSVASTAWMKYKNSSDITGAYVIMYNKHTNYDTGVAYPGNSTAYNRAVGTGNIVDSSKWIGGNRAYGGMGIYIITGDTPFMLKATVTGAWLDDDNNSELFVFVNNIKMNYSNGWKVASRHSSNVFDVCEYQYIIPANSAVYLEIIDSIEITSAANLDQSDYTNFRIATSLYINNSTFLYSSAFTNGVASGTISQATDMVYAPAETYTKSNITIINTTKYNSALYNVYRGGQQEYRGHVTLINNTSNKMKVTLNFSINYFISNGQNLLFTGSSGSYTYASSFNNPSLWYREDKNASSGFGVNVNAEHFTLLGNTAILNTYIAPFSAVNVLESYSVSLHSVIEAQYNNYDTWSELEPTITSNNTTTETSNKILVDTTISRSPTRTTLIVSVKNNTSETLSITNVPYTISERIANYSPLSVKPSDWESNYWEYYYYSSGSYIRNNSKTWAASTYYSLSYTMQQIDLGSWHENESLASDLYDNVNKRFNVTLKLNPGELQIVQRLFIDEIAKDYVITTTNATATITEPSNTIQVVGARNHGATYIKNYSTTNSYYVRSQIYGLGNNAVIDSQEYVYYLGIVRPGQVHLCWTGMTEGAGYWISFIQAGDTYTPSTLSAWGSEAQEFFDRYFSNE